MKITIKFNQPIGNFKAIEKTETYYCNKMWEHAGTNLVYLQNGYNTTAVSKNEIVKIEK